jgi:hypothetical protein
VGALGSLKRKQKKIRIFPSEIVNCRAYLRLLTCGVVRQETPWKHLADYVMTWYRLSGETNNFWSSNVGLLGDNLPRIQDYCRPNIACCFLKVCFSDSVLRYNLSSGNR